MFCFSPSYFRNEMLFSCYRLSAVCCTQAAAPSAIPRCPSLSKPGWKHQPENSQQHKGFCFILYGTPAPAKRTKVLHIATIMVTKVPRATPRAFWLLRDFPWGEREGVLLPCPLLSSPEKLQTRMPINANWDFCFIWTYVH